MPIKDKQQKAASDKAYKERKKEERKKDPEKERAHRGRCAEHARNYRAAQKAQREAAAMNDGTPNQQDPPRAAAAMNDATPSQQDPPSSARRVLNMPDTSSSQGRPPLLPGSVFDRIMDGFSLGQEGIQAIKEGNQAIQEGHQAIQVGSQAIAQVIQGGNQLFGMMLQNPSHVVTLVNTPLRHRPEGRTPTSLGAIQEEGAAGSYPEENICPPPWASPSVFHPQQQQPLPATPSAFPSSSAPTNFLFGAETAASVVDTGAFHHQKPAAPMLVRVVETGSAAPATSQAAGPKTAVLFSSTNAAQAASSQAAGPKTTGSFSLTNTTQASFGFPRTTTTAPSTATAATSSGGFNFGPNIGATTFTFGSAMSGANDNSDGISAQEGSGGPNPFAGFSFSGPVPAPPAASAFGNSRSILDDVPQSHFNFPSASGTDPLANSNSGTRMTRSKTKRSVMEAGSEMHVDEEENQPAWKPVKRRRLDS